MKKRRRSPHRWTEEQIEFLRRHYPEHPRRELLEKLNEHFELNLSLSQLKGCIANHGIKSGRTGYFAKGSIPYNKGTKGISTGGGATRFKPGNRPHNWKPVGSESQRNEGDYVLVKVAEEGTQKERWKPKHHLVWERERGPIPKDHVLVFLDQDKTNIEIDNLRMVKREHVLRMNQKRLISKNPEVTEAGITITKIRSTMRKRVDGKEGEKGGTS